MNNVPVEGAYFMDRLRRLSRPIAHAVVLGVLALSIHIPAAQAGLIGTEVALNAQQAAQDRDRVQQLLNRDDVKAQLLGAGVDPMQIAARVDALSDAEVQQLAAKMEQMPAGGDALGLAVFVFVLLLITDILGFTDVFPFVKKPVR